MRAAELVRRRCLGPQAYRSSPAHPELPRQLVSQVGYVEGLNDARTPLGTRRVSARLGWAGEKDGFFSILLEAPRRANV